MWKTWDGNIWWVKSVFAWLWLTCTHQVISICDIINWCNVAVKLESISSKGQTLEHDFHVLKILSGGKGLPNVQWFGSEGGYNAIVFDCLGLSLGDLFIGSNYKICRRTASNLAKQLVSQTNYFILQIHYLQHIHSWNIVHHDLKPSNILMGIGNWASIFYVIDFGLAKEFRSLDTHCHIPFHCGWGLTRTSHFMSYHSHLGYKLGRWDDFESFTYILIYLLHGGLPWQGLVSHESWPYSSSKVGDFHWGVLIWASGRVHYIAELFPCTGFQHQAQLWLFE